jgi:anthranilate synthase component 1
MVPIFRELLADLLTPVRAFTLLCPQGQKGFLLESVEGGERLARYSYVSFEADPFDLGDGDPLVALEQVIRESPAPVAGLPRFFGGVVGYLGYEAARHFEKLPQAVAGGPPLPESAFLRAENLVVFDHVTRRLKLLTIHRPASEGYADAIARIDAMEACLAAEGHNPETKPDRRGSQWKSNVSKGEFSGMVDAAREYIHAGDAFQIVLSQRFSKSLEARPFDIYRCLRALNPSPYMFHLCLGDGNYVIGTSPELLVRVQEGHAETRPLAGTRRRDSDQVKDQALEAELLADPKERAEHVMLVDLGRNDIGRVSEPGTVRVERLMEIERYSHVMHISSTVSGELAEGQSSLDALRSTFPAGTLSGAPKIRAMEIVAELEPEQRGPYGGAAGCISFGGNLDMAITLRTLVISADKVYVQAGAGIVADSLPEREFEETLEKSGAMFDAVSQAEEMP